MPKTNAAKKHPSPARDSSTVDRGTTQTRDAILAAALDEFAEMGFAGARIENIARRSGINKSLIYRYFVDKPGLFQEALRELFVNRSLLTHRQPKDLSESLFFWFQATQHDPQYVRLLLREALEDNGGEVVEEERRRDHYREHVRIAAEQQSEGRINPAIDRESLLLACAALSMFPAVFPQLTRLMTGDAVDSPAFVGRWKKMLRQVAQALEPRGPKTS